MSYKNHKCKECGKRWASKTSAQNCGSRCRRNQHVSAEVKAISMPSEQPAHGMPSVSIRPATVEDVGHLYKMIVELAAFERMSEDVVCTVDDLQRELFPATADELAQQGDRGDQEDPVSSIILRKGTSALIAERQWTGQEASCPNPSYLVQHETCAREIVGFCLFFTSFSTFLGRHGIYLEDLYVREVYRRRGIGRALLRSLARIAVKNNLGRLEWSVLKWNAKAISFYEAIGAKPQDEWDVYRLAGDALYKFGQS